VHVMAKLVSTYLRDNRNRDAKRVLLCVDSDQLISTLERSTRYSTIAFGKSAAAAEKHARERGSTFLPAIFVLTTFLPAIFCTIPLVSLHAASHIHIHRHRSPIVPSPSHHRSNLYTPMLSNQPTMRASNIIERRMSHSTTSFHLLLLMSLLLSSPPTWAGAFNCRGSASCGERRTSWSTAAATDPSRLSRYYGSLASSSSSSLPSLVQLPLWDIPRGGGEAVNLNDETGPGADSPSMAFSSVSSTTLLQTASTFPTLSSVSLLLKTAGSFYARYLTLYPILTKSLTAGIIFGFSDWVAQIIEKKNQDDGTAPTTASVSVSAPDGRARIISSFLVGTLFFGPAAHAWYAAIFSLLPSTTLPSTLTKAALGQVIFGPLFTCVYFLANMLSRPDGFQSFTLASYKNKIVSDLPGVWKSGLGYWPLVDLIGYAVVNPNFLPLYVNGASFVWTVYLSGVTNKK
jgi:protein Mpv17